MNPKEEGILLRDLGYRVVSRRYGMVSRLDRDDWVLTETHFHGCPSGDNEDWYRRCRSKDKKTVRESVARYIPTSCHAQVGYIP
jgi:hypothetical protein